MGSSNSQPENSTNENVIAKEQHDEWLRNLFRGDLSDKPKVHKLGNEEFVCDLEYYREAIKEEMEVILWPWFWWNWWWVQTFSFLGILFPAEKARS